MANDFSRNPWVIDTVMPSPRFDWVWIQDLVWSDFGVADALVIKDASGGILLDTKTTAANTENYQSFPTKGKFHGFQVTTLTAGGKVLVYLK